MTREHPKHRRFISSLACCVCGGAPSECAHVRMGHFGGISVPANDRGGMGMKSHDKWTVPLCPKCHRLDTDSQHNIGERPFWERAGINPIALAFALWTNTGNLSACRGIVLRAVMKKAI